MKTFFRTIHFGPTQAISNRARRVITQILFAIALGLFAGGTIAVSAATPPPVVFSVEPEENGKVVYLPIAAQTANDSPSGLFGLRVNVANNGTTDIRMTGIRVSFTVNNGGFGSQFIRDLVVPAGESVIEYLTPEESIQLPDPAPASVKIDLLFDGYDLPKTIERNLAPYEPPTAFGSYLFPANEDDLGPEEYFSHVDPHTGGSQFFGYDLHVREWNGQSFSAVKAGADPNTNEGQVGWNFPIRALADGVVLRSSLGWENNPAPGLRALQRMGEVEAGPTTAAAVTKLSATRAACFSRFPNQSFSIFVWDVLDEGRQLVPLGTKTGDTGDLIAADALSSSRMVSAFRTTSGNLRLVVWDVSSDGMTITRLGQRDDAAVQEIALIKLSSSQFVTAVRTTSGDLQIALWGVSSDGLGISLASQDKAGAVSSISLAALTSSRIAASLRDGQGRLKVIVWDVLNNGTTLVRRGEATDQLATQTSAVAVSSSGLDTAMRTDGGTLRLVRWTVSSDGQTIAPELEAEAGQIQYVKLSPNFQSSVLTSIITGDGNLKLILWKPPGDNDSPGAFLRWGEADGGPTDVLDIDALDTGLHLSAVRTVTGNLKLISWHMGSGGGNCLYILHGNCRVLYAHFREGTVDPAVAYPGARVAAGQFLGRMGNSGSSEGPHTHIHAERISSLLSVEEAIEQESNGTLQLLGYRPIPFRCARAVRLSALQPGGEEANLFSSLWGHGVYFTQFAIRPTWLQEMYVDWTSSCPAPTGRKDCQELGPLSFGGAYPTVNGALNESCWGHQLFIRGGSYSEAVLMDRAMTVRSYDGSAVIGQ